MADESNDPFAKYAKAASGSDDDPFAKYAPKGASGPKPSVLESVGRGAVEGATFGFDDKLGMDKEAREASRKANPWAHFMGELAAGIAPMAAATLLPTGVGQAAAAGRGAQLLSRAAGLARAAFVPGEIATTAQAVGQGAKLGSVYGGLSGAGHADVADTDSTLDALGKRAVGATKGSALGALVGAPLGAVGHGVYRGAQNLGQLFTDTAAETAGAGQGALVKATKRLEQDRITPQEIMDNIRSEFPSDTAAAGGPGVRWWGPGNVPAPQRGVWTADMVEDIVRSAAAGDSAADISTALTQKLGGKGPGADAVQTMLDELASRHLGPLNLVDRASMARTGSGENTQMGLRVAGNLPGEANANIREGLLERQLGSQNRLQGLIERMVGSSDLEGTIAAQRERFQNAASKLYAPAFAEEKPFNLAPLFMATEAQFNKMRGLIPDEMRGRLNAMMWKEALPDGSGRVARVPPQDLQSFMYAREGLRDMINELPQGNNLRRHLSKFYNDMTDVVAADNPKWKIANDFYGEGSAPVEKAQELGKQLATRQGAASREALTELTQADKDSKAAKKALSQAKTAYDAARKQGASTPDQQAAYELAKARFDAIDARQRIMRTAYAQNLTDMLANQGETHDLVRKLLMPGSRSIMTKVLGDDAPAFINGLRAEGAMTRTYNSLRGSQTTPLKEAIAEDSYAPRFQADISMLNPLTWINPALKLAQEYGARTLHAKRNADLAKLYTETDPLKQLEALRAMQSLHQARSAAGNLVGKPAIGLGSGLFPEALVGTEGATQRRP